MSYSRSRTNERQRSRRSSRIRYLIAFNLVLLVLAGGTVYWLFSHYDLGSRFQTTPSDSPGASKSQEPSASSNSSSPSPEASSSADSSGNGAAGADPAGTGSDKLTMAFVGDILPAANVAQLMRKLGYDYPFRKAAGLLKSADIAAANLETPITARGTPAENKQYLFRGPVEALPAISDAGFDVLSLANNHTLDFGWVGLQDTMDALDDHHLHHMGSGNDDQEAFTPVYIESRGMTVAFVGVTRVVPEVSWKADRNHPGVAEAYNPARAVEAIKEAKKQADLVVVMVHWGVELAVSPNIRQTDLGHRFIDAGADLVVGSHPHVLQGFESYKNKWIAYSLGNFVFNTTSSPRTSETGVLTAICSKAGDCSLELHPMLAKDSQPVPMSEEAGKALLSRLSAVSTAAEVKENGDLVAKR